MRRRPIASIFPSISLPRSRAIRRRSTGRASALPCRLMGARDVRDRVGRAARPRHRPPHDAASGQGRLLGQRDQTRPGTRAQELSRVYRPARTRMSSYLACTRRLFAARDVIYPQFATHNAFTVAAVLELAPSGARYEFQRLHGMGEALYSIAAEAIPGFRTYASMHPWEATKICCPTWCGGCSRTEPIRLSFIIS